MHDTLDGVLHILRSEGHPIVPLHAFVEVEGDGFTAIADVPGVRQLGDEVQGHGVIRTGAEQTVIGRSHRRIDPSEGGLMHVVKRDLLVARTEEFAPIPRLFAVRCGQRQRPLPCHLNVGRGSRLGQRQQRHADDHQ